jgi:hypothetical protein
MLAIDKHEKDIYIYISIYIYIYIYIVVKTFKVKSPRNKLGYFGFLNDSLKLFTVVPPKDAFT